RRDRGRGLRGRLVRREAVPCGADHQRSSRDDRRAGPREPLFDVKMIHNWCAVLSSLSQDRVYEVRRRAALRGRYSSITCVIGTDAGGWLLAAGSGLLVAGGFWLLAGVRPPASQKPAASYLPALPSGSSGSVTVNVEPRPVSLATSTAPPCASTTAFTRL